MLEGNSENGNRKNCEEPIACGNQAAEAAEQCADPDDVKGFFVDKDWSKWAKKIASELKRVEDNFFNLEE